MKKIKYEIIKISLIYPQSKAKTYIKFKSIKIYFYFYYFIYEICNPFIEKSFNLKKFLQIVVTNKV